MADLYSMISTDDPAVSDEEAKALYQAMGNLYRSKREYHQGLIAKYGLEIAFEGTDGHGIH